MAKVRRLTGRAVRVHPARVETLPVRVRPTVQVPVTAHKTTFTRTNLPDGDFMINYYYCRSASGDLVPEDIESATHFERVVYDSAGNVIGSMLGELNNSIKW